MSAGGSTTFVTTAWSDDLRVLRAAAGSRLRTEWLQRWWCKKYNRPRKDPLLNEYTLEELMIEYLEDAIEIDPQEEFSRETRESGMFIHRSGDKLMDQWQEKTARGEKIDFSEAFTSEESKRAFEKIRQKSRDRFKKRNDMKDVAPVEEIHDCYGGDVDER